MNEYVKNPNRIEFVVTTACTGRCKHCSEGEHIGKGRAEHIDADAAVEATGEDFGPLLKNRILTHAQNRGYI